MNTARFANVHMAAHDTYPLIVIVADDLTGALDAAAPLQRQGFAAAVALTPAALASVRNVPIVAVTTESRHLADPYPALAATIAALPPADPYPALAATIAALPPADLIYKKIDSTLRGPIADELRTLLALTGRRAALITPTLPHQRRALINGYLHVDGVRTDIHLPTLLQAANLPTLAIPLAVVRDHAALRAALLQAVREPVCIAIDAVTDDDLQAIAEAAAALPDPVLLAGSAGLAAWLPRVANLLAPMPSIPAVPPDGPVLFAFGSAHPRTHEQLDHLRGESLVSITLDPAADLLLVINACVAALAIGDDVMLAVVPPLAPIASVPIATQRVVAQTLARVVGAVRERTTVRSVVVGGGDTAYAVCDHLGIQRLTLAGEVLPGLPLSHGTTSAGNTLWCVTKAGGFGAPDALRHVRAALHGATRR